MDRSSLPAASVSVAIDAPAPVSRECLPAPAAPPVHPPLKDPKASRILNVLLKLLPYEDALRQWGAASGDNARLLMRNPVEAAVAANPGLPTALLEELRAVSTLIGGPCRR